MSNLILFDFHQGNLGQSLQQKLGAVAGEINRREFPDGETYLQVESQVTGCDCLVLADLSWPNSKYLPLLFLAETLRELGARSVGLVAPYLCYMRQDKRFIEGEAVTSAIFARHLSTFVDWLLTVDPHLHRYNSLDEIYTIPSEVVAGAPALANWLKDQQNLLLVGPDEESRQWVAEIAGVAGHPFVVGSKQRFGDQDVQVTLPDLSAYQDYTAVIVDDVISSGYTILKAMQALQLQGFKRVQCIAVHGIFANNSDDLLYKAGLHQLVTSNTITHTSNGVDIAPLLIAPIKRLLEQT